MHKKEVLNHNLDMFFFMLWHGSVMTRILDLQQEVPGLPMLSDDLGQVVHAYIPSGIP